MFCNILFSVVVGSQDIEEEVKKIYILKENSYNLRVIKKFG